MEEFKQYCMDIANAILKSLESSEYQSKKVLLNKNNNENNSTEKPTDDKVD